MEKNLASKMGGVYRTTKCFGAKTAKNGIDIIGAFPNGFLKWLQGNDWWGDNRVYLCAGAVKDDDAVRVDIRAEMSPTHCEDARHTSLPNNEYDLVILDPPYSEQLADELYGTKEHYSGINGLTKEAQRICAPGGLIVTLTYEIPKRIKNCSFIAVCGIYTIPATSYMRCLTVSKKDD